MRMHHDEYVLLQDKKRTGRKRGENVGYAVLRISHISPVFLKVYSIFYLLQIEVEVYLKDIVYKYSQVSERVFSVIDITVDHRKI